MPVVDGGDDQVLLRLEHAVAKAGSVTKLQVLSTRDVGSVFLDVVQGRQTVLTKTLDLEGGKANLELSIPPEMAGTLELHAYLLRRDGEFVRDGRVMVVEPADELRIDVSQNQPEYLPGEHAKIRFAVTDAAGRPKAAALGVIMVDEAVYALQEMQPGLEKIYFLLEREILKPRYELHFAPGGMTVDDMVRRRDIPEASQKAAMILLAGAEPDAPWSLDQNKAAEREAFRTGKLRRIYDALEKLVGFTGPGPAHHDNRPGALKDDVLNRAVAARLLTDDARNRAGRPPRLHRRPRGPRRAASEIDLANRAARASCTPTASSRCGRCREERCEQDQDNYYYGNGQYCVPSDIFEAALDAAQRASAAIERAASRCGIRGPRVRRASCRRTVTEGPDWTIGRIEIFSKGPDGRSDTEDDEVGLVRDPTRSSCPRASTASTCRARHGPTTTALSRWSRRGEKKQAENERQEGRWDRMRGGMPAAGWGDAADGGGAGRWFSADAASVETTAMR